MRKVAILGGTFDPVHCGHLLIAQTALTQFALDQVIWLPTHCPPHKKKVAKFEHRWEMVSRAIADYPAFVMSPLTNDLKPTYAIETLIALQAFYPNTHWYWIVGLDAFQTLPRWYRRQELMSACEWLVAPRGDGGDEQVCERVLRELGQGMKICWQLLPMPKVEISSSLVRQYCREQRNLNHLVPETVKSYLVTHNLYSTEME